VTDLPDTGTKRTATLTKDLGLRVTSLWSTTKGRAQSPMYTVTYSSIMKQKIQRGGEWCVQNWRGGGERLEHGHNGNGMSKRYKIQNNIFQ
jgi:hypothetical protein